MHKTDIFSPCSESKNFMFSPWSYHIQGHVE